MNTFTLIKSTFTNPLLLLEARKKNGFIIFIYMLLLSIIMSIPIFVQSVSLLASLREDGGKIMKKIPDFSISDGTLVTHKKDSGFIYQTNGMIFTFDPEGKRDKKEIEADALSGVLSVALMKNEAIIVLPSIAATSDLLDNHVILMPYSIPQVNNLNKTTLNQFLTSQSNRTIMLILIFVISTLMVLVSFLVNLIIMTFFANLFSKFSIIGLKFKDTFKILVFCSFFPILVTVILQLIWPSFNYGAIILALTLVIYFNIFPRPKRPKK